MGVLRVCPDWITIAPAIDDEGRRVASLTFPDGHGGEIELVVDLPMLGQLSAEADGIRETAMAWG